MSAVNSWQREPRRGKEGNCHDGQRAKGGAGGNKQRREREGRKIPKGRSDDEKGKMEQPICGGWKGKNWGLAESGQG